MSCLRSLLSLVLTLGGIALIVYGVTHWSGGPGNLVEVGLGGVLILLGIVNSANIAVGIISSRDILRFMAVKYARSRG